MALLRTALLASLLGAAQAKIAFLFMTPGHLPLAKTWHNFFDAAPANSFTIYVHTSPGFILNATTVDSPFFYDTQLPNTTAAAWCSVNTVKAEQRLYEAALSDPEVQWLVLLSDHCAPLRPFSFVRDYLSRAPSSLIESYDTNDRFEENIFNASIIPRSAWRKGTQWGTLTRLDAGIIVRDEHGVVDEMARAIAKAPTKEACRPLDEHFKQIILLKAGRTGVWQTTMAATFLTFAGYHPIMYHAANIVNITALDSNLRNDQVFATLTPVESAAFVRSRHAEVNVDPASGWEHRWLWARKFSSAAGAQLWRDVIAASKG